MCGVLRRQGKDGTHTMFSGFDNFAEGFKRFSLDSLQQDEEREEDGKNKDTSREERMPVVHEKTTELGDSITTVKKLPSRPNEDANEWDWDEGNAAATAEKKEPSKVDGSLQQHASHVQRQPDSSATGGSLSAAGVSLTSASPVQLKQSSPRKMSSRVGDQSDKPQGENVGTDAAAECQEHRREEDTFAEGRAPSGAEGLAASPSPSATPVVEVSVSYQDVAGVGASRQFFGTPSWRTSEALD